MSGIGYGNVPEGEHGWDGNWGAVPIQGPPSAGCARCGTAREQHRYVPRSRCEGWQRPPTPPTDEETVVAEVITRWTCHACGEENDVAGEGAVNSWMDCAHCPESSYLVPE